MYYLSLDPSIKALDSSQWFLNQIVKMQQWWKLCNIVQQWWKWC